MANAGAAMLGSPHKTSLSSDDYAASPSAVESHATGAGNGTWVECVDVMTLSIPSDVNEAMLRMNSNLPYYRESYFAFTMITMVAFL